MRIVETIAERRIRQAREDGLFDDLPGRGKPIADLHRQRPPGWWGMRQVETERSKVAAEDLHDELRPERAALWRLGTEAEVTARVAELNRRIAHHNRRHPLGPAPAIDLDRTLATWRRLRRTDGAP
ncbi:MAG: DnaJ family domain-containing protein [Actinomycetota bacterium]